MQDWRSASVLVTGGTGSFGRKFVEIMLQEYRPRRIIVFSRDELKQHQMREVFPDAGKSPMRYFIGDVRDRERLTRAFQDVDVVVHAAALKQVPACEYNPFEAVKTNILGTKNVIDAALSRGVAKVLALSSDKAVNPVNLYGATKLCAEKMFVQANAYSGKANTRFGVCRYGNVVGSRGSVVPLFAQQRITGGCLTITDPRMTRFWLTLEQGVRFVINCIEIFSGGEIFVPRIPSMRITDLASAVAPECEQQVVGIRPGEKLHEVLLSEDEARHSYELEDMFVVQPLHPWWSTQESCGSKKLPDGFRYSSDGNSDWLTVEDLRNMLDFSERHAADV